MDKNIGDTNKATSLTRSMPKYGLLQGVAFSAVVAGIETFVPGVFTSDATIQSLQFQSLPHVAFQQTLINPALILEGLAISGNDFRCMAAVMAVATAAGVYKMLHTNSVTAIWFTAVNTFVGARFLDGLTD
jgi:Na+-driven multidrug efflux pump